MSVARIITIIPALALGAALLTACGPGTADPTPEPTTASESATPTPEPTPEPTVDPTVPDTGLVTDVIDAISSGNTAAIEGYLAPSVHVTYCASEAEGDVTDSMLVINNITDFIQPITATWDFDLPADKLDTYANDPGHYPSYADDFPAGAIVGLSSDRKVISFVVAGVQITRVFMCADEYALTFEE